MASVTAEAVPEKDSAREKTFLGHPRGLAFLAFTEAWERFSFYGMRALLVLYLVQELLLPGHVENVAGMAATRSAIEGMVGPLSTQAFASQLFGFYAGLVYLTPLFGGLIADRWLGSRRTVLLGIALMTAGHLAMAFEWAVLLALLLLILGSGCLKGNIAAQVGRLYPSQEEARRSRGYMLFSTGINVGATIGPLVIGLMAQLYGWHVAFGTAGVLMLLAAGTYMAGWRHYAADAPRGRQARADRAPLSSADWRIIGLIVVVLLLGLLQTFAYDQTSNVGVIWLSERVALDTSFGRIPEAWFIAEDSLFSILAVPIMIAIYRHQAERGREPHDLGKIALGGVVMGLSACTFAVGDWLSGGGPVSPLVPLIGYALSGTSFIIMWPVTLALVSRRAPLQVNSLMMAGAYLTVFASGIFTGWLARFYEPLGATAFFLVHAGLAVSSSALILLLGRGLIGRMDALEQAASGSFTE